MGENKQDEQTQGGESKVSADDLALVDERIEDDVTDPAALWAELDQAEAASTSTDDSETPPEKQGREDKSGDGADAAAKDGHDAEAGGTAKTGDAETRADDDDEPSDGKSDGAKQQTQDIWAAASPEQRAAFEAAQNDLRKLQQSDRSNRGRLSAMQRQINELMTPRQEAAPKEAAKGEAGKGTGQHDDADGFLASDDWKSFAKEYPEVAGPLGKLIGNMQTQVTRQAKELSAIGSERRQAALSEQAEMLAGEHPDWEDVTADRGFPDWLKGQPRHIREAAFRNASEIVDAEEAADVVGRFKQFRTQQSGHAAPRKNETNTSQAGNGGDTSNPRLSGRRKQQLESASAARTRGPGAASGIAEDGDPETIWKQFDDAERRQRA